MCRYASGLSGQTVNLIPIVENIGGSNPSLPTILKGFRMKITYDSEAKAMYIQLKGEPNHLKTLELSDSVNVDYDKDLEIFGIEILNVEKMPKIKNIT